MDISFIKRGYWISSIIAVSMNLITINYFGSFGPTKDYIHYAEYIRIFAPMLGSFLGGAILSYGRRRVILISDFVFIMLAFFIIAARLLLDAYEIIDLVTVFLVEFWKGLVYLGILIYVKELPPLNLIGSSITIFYSFYWIGKLVDVMTIYVLGIFGHSDYQHTDSRIIRIAIGSIPVILQIILLLTFFQEGNSRVLDNE